MAPATHFNVLVEDLRRITFVTAGPALTPEAKDVSEASDSQAAAGSDSG